MRAELIFRSEYCLCILLQLTFLCSQVFSIGTFQVRLTSYHDSCCSTRSGQIDCTMSPRVSSTYKNSCRTFFRICLSHDQPVIPSNPPCTFGQYFTDVINNRNQRQLFKQPINITFEHTWQRNFSLIIEVWRDVTLDGPRPGSPRDLIVRDVVKSSVTSSYSWSKAARRVHAANLTYLYRVVCDTHYYGPGCSDFCKPRDDVFGHYTCSENGTKICETGWEGEYCNRAICLLGCDAAHGYCDHPNECHCRLGWRGERCNECIPYPGCEHGTCTEPWKCNCLDGWGGLFCNQDLNACATNKPCLNGAVCVDGGPGRYRCVCPRGFTGVHCQQRTTDCPFVEGVPSDGCHHTVSKICDQHFCLNGGSCVPGPRCVCPPLFSGRQCELPVTVNICRHLPVGVCQNGGTCRALPGPDFVCRCRIGFTGTLCQTHVDDCTLSPCASGGLCVAATSGGFRCVCPSGLSGTDCRSVHDCRTEECLNGGVCSPDGIVCTCNSGFVGSKCEFNTERRKAVVSTSWSFQTDEINRRNLDNRLLLIGIILGMSLPLIVGLTICLVRIKTGRCRGRRPTRRDSGAEQQVIALPHIRIRNNLLDRTHSKTTHLTEAKYSSAGNLKITNKTNDVSASTVKHWRVDNINPDTINCKYLSGSYGIDEPWQNCSFRTDRTQISEDGGIHTPMTRPAFDAWTSNHCDLKDQGRSSRDSDCKAADFVAECNYT